MVLFDCHHILARRQIICLKRSYRPFIGYPQDMPKWKPREIPCQCKKTGYLVTILAIFTLSVSSPVAGQELYILGGDVNSSSETSYAWQISYMEGLSEHFAYSISWLNEGHLTGHHRDGPTFQL